jgi:hypothetical protein
MKSDMYQCIMPPETILTVYISNINTALLQILFFIDFIMHTY